MSAAVYSMTGYASVRVDSDDHASFTLTMKSVNHRFLDLQVRLPQGFDGIEAQIRKTLKEQVQRGHVEFTLQVDRAAASPGVVLNAELLAAYVAAFREAAATHGLSGEPNLNDVLRVPGMMSGQAATSRDETAAVEAAVIGGLGDLIARFNAARAGEGAALVAELRASMLRLDALAEEASGLREGVRAASFERLRVRIAEVTKGLAVVDPDRLLAEAALVADKSDIEEELVRLRTHAEGFVAMLDAGGPVGKRLDFLLQELNREANTLLSKTGGASSQNGLRITELGLEMKMEIERAKEQVQNLE
jgi:uncharacterized protein (TIGR00255 family)